MFINFKKNFFELDHGNKEPNSGSKMIMGTNFTSIYVKIS